MSNKKFKFNLKKVKCNLDKMVDLIKLDYLYNNDVCLDEYLNFIQINHATINDIVYIFARLHKDIEDDLVYIKSEGIFQDILKYL